MTTVRIVAIPEDDAELLLIGLRNQSSGGYTFDWIELCDRMVERLTHSRDGGRDVPLTHYEDMAQASEQLSKMGEPDPQPNDYVTLDQLLWALNSTALRYMDYGVGARDPYVKTMWSVAGNLLLDLKTALADPPERAGSGAPPANPTGATNTEAAESATVTPGPALKCGALHPWMANVWCDIVPGDHRDRRHQAHSTDGFRTVVEWQS